MEVEVARLSSKIQSPKSGLAQLKTKIYQPTWAGLIGVAVMAVYLALLPWVERTWRTTGDEPHYLLAAHSLVTDGDFDLANNYDRLDYLAFYYSKDITRQVRVSPAGQQILNHQLGLPVFIAPAYALAGRLGVLVFQAILGGLLAMLTFKLAALVSRDEWAALWATLFVTLSPPLLLYPYLVYPELIAALLTTLVTYYLVRRPELTPGVAGGVMLALLTLPWLNRRFIPLAILLALLVAWTWSQQKSANRSARLYSVASLVVMALSLAGLFWFNSRLRPLENPDITLPAGPLIWYHLARGLGWLVDQQRGLFIYAPIYILALWGLPCLFGGLLARLRNSPPDWPSLAGHLLAEPHWVVILPFLLAWGITTVAGGFWVAWELGPRFLVVGLPALAPLLALAWRNYGRQKIWAGLALALFGLSLSNSLVILQNPELPYKSSLPLFYGEKWGVALTEWLPNLADSMRISPAEADPAAAPLTSEHGEPVWFAEAGRSLSLVQSQPLTELPFGHYRLSWPLRTEAHLAPETELVQISVKLLGGGQVFNKIISAADLPGDGSYGMVVEAFNNPNVDRWRTPMIFSATSTGQSNVWAREVMLTPAPVYAWLLPYLYLVLLLAGALLSWYISGRRLPPDDRPVGLWSGPGVMGGLLVLLPLAAFGYLIYDQAQSSRTYDAATFNHFVGRSIIDPAAQDSQAWLVDPQVDPPQKAIYGPFDIYDPGSYQVTFRIKLPEPIETGQELARLQVNATANFDQLRTQPLRPEHFSKPDLYHDFVLPVNNPRRQALSFEVYYLGVAPLLIDEVTISKQGGGGAGEQGSR